MLALTWTALFLFVSATPDRSSAPVVEDAAVLSPCRFTGWVVDPAGGPLAGVIVSSSAGGECRTQGDGSFTLDIGLAPGVGTVRLFAELPAGDAPMPPPFLAELEVLAEPDGTTSVGPLVLEAADCTQRWVRTFGEIAGTRSGRVAALASFDHGTGSRLYVGGSFLTIGGVAKPYLACWNGERYVEVGSGVDGQVDDLVVHDDGSGPALYVAGEFTTAGGVASQGVARWDGATWSDVGGGLNGRALALCVYDDGTGPTLYATGSFSQAGGSPASRIAKWDGTDWSSLKAGINGIGRSLTVFDDGSGPLLVVGGSFSQAGIIPSFFLAHWDGSRWGKFPTLGAPFPVQAVAVTNDPGGQVLHVAGSPPNSVTFYVFASWNGSIWITLFGALTSTIGAPPEVRALAGYDDGSGEDLYLGGTFDFAGGQPARRFANYNGSFFSSAFNGIGAKAPQRAVDTLDPVEHEGSPKLGVGGFFTRAGSKVAHRVALYSPFGFEAIGTGLDDEVADLVEFDDGTGPELWVGGAFKAFGDTRAAGVARWKGQSFAKVGGGGPLIPSITSVGSVEALAVHDDGAGPALYAGGKFEGIDGVAAEAIAKWDGSAWSSVGPGFPGGGFPGGLVIDLASYDDGGGAKLFAAGDLDPGGALYLSEWDGSSWQEVGGGLSKPVRVLAVYDDGSGPKLLVGGQFRFAGGVQVNRVALWDGASWSPLGAGFNGDVNAFEVWDDGSGPALYAAGNFTMSGTTPVRRLARWNGTSWSAVGAGLDAEVFALEGLDLGEGPALWAGGDFLVAGTAAAHRVARWTGTDWEPVQRGVPGRVRRLFAHDDGSGPSLLVGGQFITSPGRDSYLARFGCD